MSRPLSPQAAAIIDRLGMVRHPEGGWYVESYRAPAPKSGRGSCTAIYFLLSAGERSHWHRVDAVEIWHWYAGAPLRLELSDDGRDSRNQKDTRRHPKRRKRMFLPHSSLRRILPTRLCSDALHFFRRLINPRRI